MPTIIQLPALRGQMGSREFFVGMFKLREIPRYFAFRDWSGLPPEMRAQRKLNPKRVPEIARYVLDNHDDYVFSSLTASFKGKADFVSSDPETNIGVVSFAGDTEFLLNDGQHRRAAIEEALREDPSLGDQNVSVVLFPFESLEKAQQDFSDLNRTAQKTSRSLDILYDYRDPVNRVTLLIENEVPLFTDRIEKDAISLSIKSGRFVTLSALYDANKQFLGEIDAEDVEEATERAAKFWNAVSEAMPEWRKVLADETKPQDVRTYYISSHGVVFWALGGAGRALLQTYPDEDEWTFKLKEALGDIDWRKANKEWQGRVMLGSDILARRQTRQAMTDYLLWKVGLMDEKPEPVLETV
jgi:DNA sulfur modification protein DndB